MTLVVEWLRFVTWFVTIYRYDKMVQETKKNRLSTFARSMMNRLMECEYRGAVRCLEMVDVRSAHYD